MQQKVSTHTQNHGTAIVLHWFGPAIDQQRDKPDMRIEAARVGELPCSHFLISDRGYVPAV